MTDNMKMNIDLCRYRNIRGARYVFWDACMTEDALDKIRAGLRARKVSYRIFPTAYGWDVWTRV